LDIPAKVIRSILCDDLDEAEKLLKINNDGLEVISDLVAKAKKLPSPLKDFTAAPPPWVGINVSYTCGLRCSMCNAGFSDRSQLYPDYLHLDEEAFGSFQPWIESGNQVVFMGAGEPLESPNAIKYLAQIRDKETWLYSSGAPLNREKTKGLINAGLDFLMLSFEGASALGHGSGNASYVQKFWEKIQMIEDLKREAGSHTPKIILRISVDNHNLGQLDDLISKAFDIGIRETILFPSTPIREEQFQDSIFFGWEAAKKTVNQIMDRWNSQGMIITILRNSKKLEDSKDSCPYVDNWATLDGKKNTASLCCGPMDAPLGLNEVPFDVLWNSFPVRYFRYLHYASDSGDLPRVCQECPVTNLASFADRDKLKELTDKEETALLYRRTSSEKNNENFDIAKKGFLKIVSESKDKELSGKSWFHLGEIEIVEGNLDKAIFSMRNAVQNHFTHSKAFAYLYLLTALEKSPTAAKSRPLYELISPG
jgi:hypothetical protein